MLRDLLLTGTLLLATLLGSSCAAEKTMAPAPLKPFLGVTLTSDGTLSPPQRLEPVVKTDDEWRALLAPEVYQVLRSAGTERPFCGGLLHNKGAGYYVCAGCALPLFHSATKFESGTGWPSFYQEVHPGNVKRITDASYGMVRVEIQCARCGGHLGHVFDDGPEPTHERHCLNSAALSFVATGTTKPVAP